MKSSPDLSPRRRARELERLADRSVDLVVIGGGVTGCGVALDAASRGHSVVLLERGDLACGTSGFSSKLVHGGLRYLAQGQFGVAAESARERHHLFTRIAPHLVRPLATVIPFNSGLSRRDRTTMRIGYKLGDALRRSAGTSAKSLARSRVVDADAAATLVPGLSRQHLNGALIGWDGQLEDDARLVVAIARTAAADGAAILTRCEVTGVERGLLHAKDLLTGSDFQIRTRHVINAGGVWAGELAEGVHLTPSKGSHIIVPAAALGGPTGSLTVPASGGGAKYVFAVPTADQTVIIGLTDTAYDGSLEAAPTIDDWEIDLLLSTISTALDDPLTRSDVIGSYSGLRPLLAPKASGGSTADVSRRHRVIEDSVSGMHTIVGGKLTTYRQMAEDAVDRISDRPCHTKSIALVGAGETAGSARAGSARGTAAGAAPDAATGESACRARLERRFGSEAARAVALAAGDRRLLEPLTDGSEITAAELRFCAAHELVLSVDDLLDRRTRAGLTPALRDALAPAAEAALAWASDNSQSETQGAGDA